MGCDEVDMIWKSGKIQEHTVIGREVMKPTGTTNNFQREARDKGSPKADQT